MSSLLFYLIILVILIAGWFLFIQQRRKKSSNYRVRRQTPVLQDDALELFDNNDEKLLSREEICTDQTQQSPYDPNLIVFKIKAFPGRPYMGYELHQALLAAGLGFDDDEGIFHRYGDNVLTLKSRIKLDKIIPMTPNCRECLTNCVSTHI